MTDAKLIAQYLRVRSADGETVLDVAKVAWVSSYEPGLRWQPFRTWPGSPSPSELSEAQAAALADPHYFRRCRRCGERNNAGHMHNADTCQGCAERFLGIVH